MESLRSALPSPRHDDQLRPVARGNARLGERFTALGEDDVQGKGHEEQVVSQGPRRVFDLFQRGPLAGGHDHHPAIRPTTPRMMAHGTTSMAA